jgi:glucose/arabinose dehydrogenase
MKHARTVGVAGLTLALAATAGSQVGYGQQKVPMAPGGFPVAPQGLANRPLPKLPIEVDTAEGMRIRVSAWITGLENPWTVAFLPDGTAFVTERPGRLRIIRDGKLDPTPVPGAPTARNLGISGEPGAVHGYMDVVLHPQFATNKLVYLAYTKPIDEKRQTTAIARGRWNGKSLEDTKDVFVGNEGNGVARIAFGRDGMLYVTTAGNGAQDGNSQGGKVLRLKDDGTVPPDNPFVGKAGYKPEIYTLGHRSSLGLAVHPVSGQMWLNENGPNGGDEINILKPGANYGWPVVSYGRTYPGPWQQNDRPGHVGYEPPIVVWIPSIAVSGMEFYTGDRLPKWKGDIFVGALRTGEVPGTGHIQRILINDKLEELRRESLLTELHQRIRDVKQGPDGLLYVVTDQAQGAILRIEPSK